MSLAFIVLEAKHPFGYATAVRHIVRMSLKDQRGKGRNDSKRCWRNRGDVLASCCCQKARSPHYRYHLPQCLLKPHRPPLGAMWGSSLAVTSTWGFADQDHLRGRIHQHGGIIAVQKRGWRLDVGAGYRRPWRGPAAVKRFDWSRRQSVHHLRQCRRPQWHEGWPSFGGGIWDTSGLTSADAGQATHWSVGANGIPALGIRMKAGNSSRPTSSEHTA